MKKVFLSIAAVALLFSTSLLTSCTKDDITNPSITLKGDKSVTIILGTTYVDAGATADDDTDGDITASITSDLSATNPNVNLKGTYTITYEVTDAAGNTGTATRTVIVKNSLDNMAGNYNATGTFDGAADTYSDAISSSSTVNNRIIFSKFLNYSNAKVYADITGSTINIPTQTFNCGSDAKDRIFIGAGAVINSTSFSIAGKVALSSAPGVQIDWNYTFTIL